jgi:hypothetical protein
MENTSPALPPAPPSNVGGGLPAYAPTQATVTQPKRSVGAAIVLTLLFGPLGLFYTDTPLVAALVILASVTLAVLTAGLSIVLTWPATVVYSAIKASNSGS